MAPTHPLPRGDTRVPILEQQNWIMITFFVFCLAMVCAVYWGDQRSVGQISRNGDNVDSERTTPLLSPDSTMLGSEAGSSAGINKTDGTSSWPSSASYGSIGSTSPTSDTSYPAP